MRLRPHEWLIIGYFSYVAAIAPLFIAEGETRWLGAAVAGVVAAILLGLARHNSILRDWAPLGFTLAAYREMNWFTPAFRDHHLEYSWIHWDRWLLDTHHLRAAIEIGRPARPGYLELCYLLVYGIAPISLAILLLNRHRDRLNTFWLAYLAGTLTAYALFPYFPSDPPRTVFHGADLPNIVTIFRRVNLAIVGEYGIHSSVVSERPRILRIRLRLGTAHRPPGAQTLRLDRRRLCALRRNRHHLWPIPFRHRRPGRLRRELPGILRHTGCPQACILTSNMKFSLLALFPAILCAADAKTEPVKVQKANYELAQRWTAAKVGKLVFDTQVTPHWLEGDRFWYSYETSHGRQFLLVDPVKKTKAPIFDVSKMAAMLTLITRTPYDAQHLPIRTIKFVKNDTVVQFELQVEKDADINGKQTILGGEQEGDMTQTTTASINDEAVPQGRGGRGGAPAANPRMRTLYFEYELASGKLTLPTEFKPEIRKPAWASISPDEKTILFARKNNLWMMDAASYALAVKKSDDTNVKETQLTTDGEEFFGYARRINGAERDQEQQQEGGAQTNAAARDKTGRVPPVMIAWSKDSKKFSVIRRDERKVADLWVIHTLENPRPTLETYKYAMPGDASVPQPHLEVFDVAAKSRKEMKVDRFKDQFVGC